MGMNEEAVVSSGEASVWSLFTESFDVFSVVLLIGSLIAVSLIVRLVLDDDDRGWDACRSQTKACGGV